MPVRKSPCWPVTLSIGRLLMLLMIGYHAPLQACFSAASMPAGEASAAPFQMQSPTAVIHAFYARLMRYQGGLPTPAILACYRPYVSSQLAHLLSNAYRLQMRVSAKVEGPPVLQGALFTSLFEGPSAIKQIKLVRQQRDVAQYRVTFVHQELDLQSQPVNVFTWQDDIFLQLTLQGWVIDDIAFRGGWPFAQQGQLQDQLRGAIAALNQSLKHN